MDPVRNPRRIAAAALAVAVLVGAAGALVARAAEDGPPEPLTRRRAALVAAATQPMPAAIAGPLGQADGALARLETARKPRVRQALVDLADAALTLAERRLALAGERGAQDRVQAELARERERARQLRGALEEALVRRAGGPGPAAPGGAKEPDPGGASAPAQDPAGTP